MKIHEALIEVRREVGAVHKGSWNKHYAFEFRGIEEVMAKVAPALIKQGVNVYPELRSIEANEVATKSSTQNQVIVTVAYHYVGPEGDEIVAVVPGEAADSGSSATSKAMSVALRIAHLQALQIPVAMVDPEAALMERSADPLRRVKEAVAEEAIRRGWQTEDGGFQPLFDDFESWSEGVPVAEAELPLWEKYLIHLKPNRKMSRPKG